MDELRLGAVESRFADIIWANEPVPSGELVKICASELCWKKSTTYTVLKKLCDRDIFRNENGIVTSKMSRDEFNTARSREFVKESFSGSLPAFIAAFAGGKPISAKEADEIMKTIESYKEG